MKKTVCCDNMILWIDVKPRSISHHDNVLGNKVNLIVAVSSEGFVWLSLTQCNTDDEMMSCFLSKLATRFTKQFGEHRKMAKMVFPVWLYVALTGPICYLMLQPYYGQ